MYRTFLWEESQLLLFARRDELPSAFCVNKSCSAEQQMDSLPIVHYWDGSRTFWWFLCMPYFGIKRVSSCKDAWWTRRNEMRLPSGGSISLASGRKQMTFSSLRLRPVRSVDRERLPESSSFSSLIPSPLICCLSTFTFPCGKHNFVLNVTQVIHSSK